MLLFSSITAHEEYEPHPDSLPQAGVPKGKIAGPFQWKSNIYPGTVRDYALYIPAQYDPAKPACLLVVQDGLRRAEGWKLPTVLDNLIFKKEMPVTIGLFISPGVVPPPNENAQPRFNRSFEYDAMGDRYARFLIEEMLPEVGKSYNLSDDPNDRAIAGSSSGAICAFTVAWERPDAFRRVLSTVGTYVSLRGGNEYPALIRKYESKPIRVFLQDGSNDLNLYGGSWWVANQQMLSALEFSGYDVEHVWGKGGHNAKHSTAIMPDALRWLWHDYPKPIKAGVAPNRRTNIVIPGEDWQLVSQGHKYTDSPAVNAAGEVFFADVEQGTIDRIGLDGQVKRFATPGSGIGGLMFGADGKLYGCHRGEEQIVRFDSDGKMETVMKKAPSNDLVMLPFGTYYTDPANRKVWFINSDGKRALVDEGVRYPNGVIASPDQTQLLVSDTRGRFTYSYQIQGDGSLAHRQRYGHVHVPDDSRDSGAGGMTVDTEGRIYLTTEMGLQIFDQLGRCHLILTKPQDAWFSNVAFGGPELNTLYVTCGDKVYRRKVNAKGVLSWQAPVQAPRPRL
jgi:sugar lactone lactonase YvrE/enterochelin esterase-like enzyme